MSIRPRISVFALLALLALTLAAWEDWIRYEHVVDLSSQGNPPPEIDAHSRTGYANDQRYFLGSKWRPQTFRWIAAIEDFSSAQHEQKVKSNGDDVRSRDGRSSLFIATLRGIASAGNLVWHLPFGLAVERSALNAPLVLQVGLFVLAAGAVGWVFGRKAALVFSALVALAPFVSEQFLPGVLDQEGAAMALGIIAAIFAAVLFCRTDLVQFRRNFSLIASALCLVAAVELEPRVGLPILLAIALARLGSLYFRERRASFSWWVWGASGALIILGVFIIKWQRRDGFSGWMSASTTIDQFTPLAAGPSGNILDWWRVSSGLAVSAVLFPIASALALTTWIWPRTEKELNSQKEPLIALSLLVLCFLAFGLFRVRWLWLAVVWACVLIAFEIISSRNSNSPRRPLLASYIVLAGLILILGAARLTSLRTAQEQGLDESDVEAMVYRDLAQWFVKHTPPGRVGVLAPPELTDELVYHGSFRGLITTDREGEENALTASRILSAVLPEEAESLMRKRGMNYIIVPSWDKVLSRLVRTSEEKRKFALLPRLEKWAPPRVLKPIPYHLPPIAGMEGQTVAIYQLVESQDEGLALSRLAEYFVEMDNDYLAKASANVLGTSFAGDPNAAIARAFVFNKIGDHAAFERELAAVAAIDTTDDDALEWDRQVARAIVLAVGKHRKEAEEATARCVKAISIDRLYSLTPLEGYRLNVLMRTFGLSYPDQSTADLAGRLANEVVQADSRETAK